MGGSVRLTLTPERIITEVLSHASLTFIKLKTKKKAHILQTLFHSPFTRILIPPGCLKGGGGKAATATATQKESVGFGKDGSHSGSGFAERFGQKGMNNGSMSWNLDV